MTLEFNSTLNGEEWVQTPVFDNPADGLAYMDEREREVVAEMEEEARRRMDLDAADPTKQNYYMRTDKRTVVKDEREFVLCQRKGVPLRVIPYTHAVQLVKEEDARKRRAVKEKRKKKTSKQARKRNR